MPEIVPLPADSAAWLAELKTRIHVAQQRASLAVNRECASSACTKGHERRDANRVQQPVGQLRRQEAVGRCARLHRAHRRSSRVTQKKRRGTRAGRLAYVGNLVARTHGLRLA